MGVSLEQFVESLAETKVLPRDGVAPFLASAEGETLDAVGLGRRLVAAGRLTKFQAKMVYEGRAKELVLGDYVLLEPIGKGGMGQVFKAQHRRMETIVALKLLRKAAVASADARQRFHREVKAAGRLVHANIVKALDAGDDRGIDYLVLEFVDGDDLAKRAKERGPLPIAEGVDYMLQAARGLAYAHAQGVVHRDIKPANLLLDRDGTVKILDMGLARVDAGELSSPESLGGMQLTQTGQVMGTVDYMSPEQAADTREADARSDIYSLGCALYRLLAGEPPYKGDTVMKVLLAHRDQPIPSLCRARPEAPPRLDEILRRMLAKLPQDRYQTMAEVVTALEGYAHPGPATDSTVAAPLSGITTLAPAAPPSRPAAAATPDSAPRLPPLRPDVGWPPAPATPAWILPAAIALGLGLVLLVGGSVAAGGIWLVFFREPPVVAQGDPPAVPVESPDPRPPQLEKKPDDASKPDPKPMEMKPAPAESPAPPPLVPKKEPDEAIPVEPKPAEIKPPQVETLQPIPPIEPPVAESRPTSPVAPPPPPVSPVPRPPTLSISTKFVSDDQVLARFEGGRWLRLAVESELKQRDRILSLAHGRPKLQIGEVNVHLDGPVLLEVGPPGPFGGPVLFVEYGRVTVVAPGKQGQLVLASPRGMAGRGQPAAEIMTPPGTTTGVEVTPQPWPDGNPPDGGQAPRLTVEIFCAAGKTEWASPGRGRQQTQLAAPFQATLTPASSFGRPSRPPAGPPGDPFGRPSRQPGDPFGRPTIDPSGARPLAAESLPDWITSPDTPPATLLRGGIAPDALLPGSQPLADSLRKLITDRRAEVSGAAGVWAIQIGEFDLALPAFRDPRYRTAWADLYAALQCEADSQEGAGRLQASLTKAFGASGQGIYRSLGGAEYIRQNAGNFVGGLEQPDLAVRVFCFEALSRATGKTYLYRPEVIVKSAVDKWKQALQRGELNQPPAE